MTKLIRYLKPFALMLVAVVGLLFVQAATELNLPNYMSDIVNTGIQQSGIENGAPKVISAQGMQLMQAFMPDGDRALVDANYTYIENDGTELSQEDGQKTEDIYTENSGVSEETQQQLNDAFGTAAWTMIYLMQDSGMTGGADASASLEDLDFSEIYAKALPMIKLIPQQTMDKAREQALEVSDSMRDQTAAAFSKAFYNELGIDVGKIQSDYILKTGLIMLAISLAGAVASILVGLLMSKTAAGMARNVRRSLFQKVESFTPNEFNKFSTASLITRTTNDITQVQTFVAMGMRMMLYAPIMGVGGIIMALNKSTSMAWVIALAVIVLLGVIGIVFAVAMPKFKMMQKLVDKLNLVSRENLSGMLVIRAFGTEKHEEKRFDKANTDIADTTLFISRVMSAMFPVMMFVMNGVSLLIVWVGAHQIEQSMLQVGDMMAYIQYAMMIIMAFLMLAMIFILVPRASVSAERIYEVLTTESSILDPASPKGFDPGMTGVVEFKDVSFKYEGAEEDVLCDINFTAKPGEVTAFIGSTGSGKSTLINLIPRFYDASEGQVMVNGVDVRDVKMHDLREEIGYVPQKGVLFSGTIASNIKYGREGATEGEVEKAAEIAQAMDFISEKTEGMDFHISEMGANVSGGQKQRLSIARALATDADVYIFDDSFSALDYKTDTALRRALKPYTRKSTVLIVAQRVSTILHADQIIVLEEGRIVGKGTHGELLKNCPTYLEIAESQLGGDEL